MSHCRICGKPVPSFYRQYHERNTCIRMRFLRGDPDVLIRYLGGALPLPSKLIVPKMPLEHGQQRLFQVVGVFE